jgi:enoyl-CoA hydratase
LTGVAPLGSPLSLKIAQGWLRGGQNPDFDACRGTEFRIVSRVATGHDVYEGIRVVIVDKDNALRWRAPRLDAAGDAKVGRHFAPVPDELDLP